MYCRIGRAHGAEGNSRAFGDFRDSTKPLPSGAKPTREAVHKQLSVYCAIQCASQIVCSATPMSSYVACVVSVDATYGRPTGWLALGSLACSSPLLPSHRVVQVPPVEGRPADHRITQPQFGHDLRLHLRCGRSRKGHDGDLRAKTTTRSRHKARTPPTTSPSQPPNTARADSVYQHLLHSTESAFVHHRQQAATIRAANRESLKARTRDFFKPTRQGAAAY